MTPDYKRFEKYIWSDHLIIRGEYFGGIAFNKNTATTIELDKELFFLLSILRRPLNLNQLNKILYNHFKKPFDENKIYLSLQELLNLGFIEISDKNKKHRATQSNNKVYNGYLSAPETVHFSITSQCNLNCPFCYENKSNPDLTLNQIKKLIDSLSMMKVFQLAIGGGEPLLRGDLLEILKYSKRKNIIPNLTTNGMFLSENIIKKLCGVVGQVNLSFNDCFSQYHSENIEKMKMLGKYHIKCGVNLLVTHNNISNLKNYLKVLTSLPLESIIILRPKPTSNKEWYEKNKLAPKDMVSLKKILDIYQNKVRIDCSLVCLMKDLSPQVLNANAIYGCVAGERFCTIRSNGDVIPCSFFIGQEYLAENIIQQSFLDIWHNAEIFKKLRMQDLNGECSGCGIAKNCKGCKVINLHEHGDITKDAKCYYGGMK